MKKENLKIVIVGVGGIGGFLSDLIARYLVHDKNVLDTQGLELILVDGDSIEKKNLERQTFLSNAVGFNKAKAKAHELRSQYGAMALSITSVEEYIDETNIMEIIPENSIVMAGVDNHKTRLLLSKYCQSLNDVLFICGGNDYYEGSAIVYLRENGIAKHPTIEAWHQEIAEPKDRNPAELSCEDLINQKSDPQLIFTNASVATTMCWYFYKYLVYIFNCETIEPSVEKINEIWFDLSTMDVDMVSRPV